MTRKPASVHKVTQHYCYVKCWLAGNSYIVNVGRVSGLALCVMPLAGTFHHAIGIATLDRHHKIIEDYQPGKGESRLGYQTRQRIYALLASEAEDKAWFGGHIYPACE